MLIRNVRNKLVVRNRQYIDKRPGLLRLNCVRTSSRLLSTFLIITLNHSHQPLRPCRIQVSRVQLRPSQFMPELSSVLDATHRGWSFSYWLHVAAIVFQRLQPLCRWFIGLVCIWRFPFVKFLQSASEDFVRYIAACYPYGTVWSCYRLCFFSLTPILHGQAFLCIPFFNAVITLSTI